MWPHSGEACDACKGKGYTWDGSKETRCWRCGGDGMQKPRPRERFIYQMRGA